MLHEDHTTSGAPSRAVAHTATTGGKSMPAVIQRTPQDWARSPKISKVLQQPPGFFSTWKEILSAINEYKVLRVNEHDARSQKLDSMVRLIGIWKDKHVNDTSQRVEGIRAVLPDLENLISYEQFELKTATYAATGRKYTSKTRDDVSFTVAKDGRNFYIKSENAKLAGHIEYVVRDGAIDLRHFEAQPEGLGLGTVLMHEFAEFADKMGIAIVDVQTAAFSAMGAYEAFGGAPRAENEEAFNRRKAQYAAEMGLRKDETQGEYIAKDHEDDTYDRFINEEANAVGKTEANKAAFKNPELSADDLEVVRSKAEQGHKVKNVRNVENVERVARLKALSPYLSYKIAALLDKTRNMMGNKWNIEG